jgi:hypothetical protein
VRAVLVLVGWWLVLAGRPATCERVDEPHAAQITCASTAANVLTRRAGSDASDARVLVAALPAAFTLPTPPRATPASVATPAIARCDSHARIRAARGPPVA